MATSAETAIALSFPASLSPLSLNLLPLRSLHPHHLPPPTRNYSIPQFVTPQRHAEATGHDAGACEPGLLEGLGGVLR